MRYGNGFLLLVTMLGLGLQMCSSLAAAAASDDLLHVRTGNDLLGGNARQDDLYTGGLGFTIEFDEVKVADKTLRRGFATLEENLFTDRVAGKRFDETWALLGRRWDTPRYSVSLFGGGVRAGRGLLGESVQNAIHRAIGSDEVQLDYVAKNRHFPVAGADVRRPLGEERKWNARSRLHLVTAPGYQHWIELEIGAAWEPVWWLQVFGSLGVRASFAEYSLLEPYLESLAPTVELGVLVGQRLRFSWTHNEYGTGLGHVNLGYRIPVRLARAAGLDSKQ